jgi:SAM-dependent MidA family methyltransferase
VTFARFMELALTHPTDGYYSRTEALLGPRGHFSTAPCLSPEFDRAVRGLLEELVDAVCRAAGATAVALVELGGGQGDLARVVLEGWETGRPDLRERVAYSMVEVGPGLRARQRRALADVIRRGWRVSWATTVDEALALGRPAVVVGNEFVDALPVHLVDVRGAEASEAWVEIHPAGTAGAGVRSTGAACAELREAWGALSPEAGAELEAVFGTVEAGALRRLSRDGIIELRPAAGSLMGRLPAAARAVCLLTIDYGEWFVDPSGAATAPLYRRTLRGYFRHQMVTDPYLRVGRQDLTADVDFRALDLHGREAGFETVIFTTVARLLRVGGAEPELPRLRAKVLEPAADALEADRHATVLEKLLDDEGLGGAFKVMLQVKE